MSAYFYRFVGVHSLLIGLFPFFLPVYLWKQGFNLSAISLFIAVTAASYCFSLWCWDRAHKRYALKGLVAISMLLANCLVAITYVEDRQIYFALLAMTNGIYSCLFWSTQRALFLECSDETSSGRKFGNFQILVTVALQIGIFIGGFLLERSGMNLVMLFSLSITVIAIWYIYKADQNETLPISLLQQKPVTFVEIVGYSDQYHSRKIFVVDGLFLFMESYFWVITLFIVVKQSFESLGILVIVLTCLFFISFIMIKNKIDSSDVDKVFISATVLYAFSWILRTFVEDGQNIQILYILLVFITFFTSFFRLAFNKRFFDIARLTYSHRYIITKSYYTQGAMFSIYLLLAYIYIDAEQPISAFNWTYAVAGILALIYICYGSGKGNRK